MLRGGSSLVVATGTIAGERNINSTTNNYMAMRPEWNGNIFTGVTTQTTITANPAHLHSVTNVNNQVTAGTVTIDGLTDLSGNPISIVLPAGLAIFDQKVFHGARCETSLKITCSSTTDKIMVLWRPI